MRIRSLLSGVHDDGLFAGRGEEKKGGQTEEQTRHHQQSRRVLAHAEASELVRSALRVNGRDWSAVLDSVRVRVVRVRLAVAAERADERSGRELSGRSRNATSARSAG